MQRRAQRISVLATSCAAALIALVAVPGADADGTHHGDRGVRLNQLQEIGTHNSYHQEATAAESALRASVSPDGEKTLEYSHPALGQQFGREKVRQIELDIFADPDGGLYATPLLRTLTLGGAYDPVMQQPGTKVLHIQDIDYHSNCLTFMRCLREVKHWSDRHSSHVPIAVLVEFKDTPVSLGSLRQTTLRKAMRQRASTSTATQQATTGVKVSALPALPFVTPLPWTTARMDTVDADIRSVFRKRDLITPDDVRGDDPSLEHAVLTRGWPTLADSRGKVLFLMDNADTYRDSYLAGHPALAGRVLFTNSTPGQPDAAFVEENDPTGANLTRIQDEVRRGYIVRTRADVDTAQARTGDTTMRDAALASGAQWVSTDYPVPGESQRFGTDYSVQLPGGPRSTAARCTPITPINAPTPCTTIRNP